MAIIGHSLGAAAILNLDHKTLANKKCIFIGIPTYIFEAMFKRIHLMGMADEVLEKVLNSISGRYSKHWKLLSPILHQDKLGSHCLFIHDEDDLSCSFTNLQDLIKNRPVQTFFTKELGHRKVLRDEQILKRMLHFIHE